MFLDVPIDISLELARKREVLKNGCDKDIHERDVNHLRDSYNAAVSLVDKYDLKEIKCVENEKIKTIEQIHEEIWEEIKEQL